MISKRIKMLGLSLPLLALGGLMLNGSARGSTGWHGQTRAPTYQECIFPPWSGGKNNSAIHKGLEFTVPEVDDLPDFHGNPFHARLVLYVGGNYFFALAPLVARFEKDHPQYRGKIYAETLPPGILLRQIKAAGTITVGNMTWSAPPDVYAAGKRKVLALIANGTLTGPAISYATNDLTIMVPRNNPAHIKSLIDLGRPGVRLAMPNPAWEGVARQIQASLKKAGGAALETMVYKTKVTNGQTILTHIHHRQTPLFLMQGIADAGVTWKSEAVFQELTGHPIRSVSIPPSMNTTAIYAGAMVRHAPHPRAASLWLKFLTSPQALAIFAKYGFKPVVPATHNLSMAHPMTHPVGTDPPGLPAVNAAATFAPPPESQIPAGPLGAMVRLGRHIFDHTGKYAKPYVGDDLSCINCHLQSGRMAYSAPLWGAYVVYPKYEAKAGKVVTFQERVQECFRFSMNGRYPPTDGKVITALTSYAAWLATDAPVGANLPGRGYRMLKAPKLPASVARGKLAFTTNCARCHGNHGQGRKIGDIYTFPPLWGPHSYNRGAGMAKAKLAAAFIKANMPLDHPGTLTNQQAWDIAVLINSHQRPPDPRKVK